MKHFWRVAVVALALAVVVLPHPAAASAPNTSGLAPWTWEQNTNGLATTSLLGASSFVASTTGWAGGFFPNILPLIYLGLGVTIAIAVAMLVSRSVKRLVKGVTGRRRRRR